ncbi:MAG: hypothetical protein OER96_11410 [Gammaproteobacteria bacterium]|nr:hypothetical protein [Gammaproteobacteria bacterium]
MTATNQMLLGVVAATSIEGQIFTKAIPRQERYILCISGVGADNARHAANELIRKGASRLLSFGFAGALDPECNAGTIVIPNTVITQGNKSFNLTSEWRDAITSRSRDSINFKTGVLLETRTIAMNPKEKQQLLNSYSADYVDMESGALAAVALQAEIPYLVLRAISDEASDTLPGFVNHFAQPGYDWKNIPIHVLKHPSNLRYLPKLVHNFRLARNNLTRVIRLTGSIFCP